MKKIFFVGCLIWSGIVTAQTIYSVPANSKGNRIVLSVANESQTSKVYSVDVSLARLPSSLRFTADSWRFPEISPSAEKECEFAFDVSRDAPIGKIDTLRFMVQDKQGAAWTKELLIRFEGPREYRLSQNYPNPFNPTTKIEFQIPFDSQVDLRVYDALGREVSTLIEEPRQAGYYETIFDARQFASGIYFLRITAEALVEKTSYTEVRRMVLLR